MQVATKDGKLKFASGAFSASLIPAAFQFTVNTIDYGLSAHDAVTYPRYGALAWDIQTLKNYDGRWLDPKVSKDVADELAKRGLKFIQTGYLDTGLGDVAIAHDDNTKEGAFVPLSSVGYTPRFNH